MRLFALCLLGLMFVVNTPLSATIVNTKHNLSADLTSPATIKADSEKEVCVFCHIPHVSRPEGKPLWNRNMPISNYTMYDSDYLRRVGYPVELDLGTVNDTPGALSRQCMSCHDGTVAVGAVYKLRRDVIDGTPIAMTNVEADGTMPTTAAGFLGTDLTVHHPVGIEYDPTVTVTNFDVGTRTIELKATPDSPIKLFEYGGKKYVECSSCHDPHTQNAKFLHVSSGANHGQNVYNTCTSCHDKTNWTGSVHQSRPDTEVYADIDVSSTYGTNKMNELGCANCHMPHNAEGVPYLNRKVLGTTCFVGAASDSTVAPCHGVGGSKDIESVLTRTYAHPVIASSDPLDPAHTNLDVLYGTGITDPHGGEGISWDTNKHAVCMDCHNPHKTGPDVHVVDGQWYPTTPTNLIGANSVLQGVSGVEPSWPPLWEKPTVFETHESATKEYQICFKCHSYWGMGDGPQLAENPASDAILTDVAWEMNIWNKSGHPVVVSTNDRNGSYAPRSLSSSLQMKPEWTGAVGTSTMYCSDCHGSSSELGGDPRGPHGSDFKYLLKGSRQFWPKKPDGVLYSMDDLGEFGTRDIDGDGSLEDESDLFCANCHNASFPHEEWRTQMAGRGYKCVTCHVVVPHGSSVSRLLGYEDFPEPYNYLGSTLQMRGFRKTDPLVTQKTDVWGNGCGGGGCHRNDSSTVDAPYDKNVFKAIQDINFWH